MKTAIGAALAGAFCTVGCAGMAPIKSDLEAFEASSKAADVFVAERGTRRVRAYRAMLLTAQTSQSAGEDYGLLMPPRKGDDRQLWLDELKDLARDSLCGAQEIRFDGADQARASVALAKGLSGYNYKSSDTITGNFKLLSNPNKPPVFPSLNARDGAKEDEAENATNACENEFEEGFKAFEYRKPAIKETGVAELAALVSSFNETVKPKVVALLDMIVSLRQRSRLNGYIREHDEEIDELIASLDQFKTDMAKGDVNEIRIGLVVDYLIAFDALSKSMTARDLSKQSPGLLPAGTVNVSDNKQGKAVLDTAAAYDAALTKIDVKAFESLIKSVKAVKKIPDQSATTLASDAIKTIKDFETAVDNLNTALEDEAFQAALKDALGD